MRPLIILKGTRAIRFEAMQSTLPESEKEKTEEYMGFADTITLTLVWKKKKDSKQPSKKSVSPMQDCLVVKVSYLYSYIPKPCPNYLRTECHSGDQWHSASIQFFFNWLKHPNFTLNFTPRSSKVGSSIRCRKLGIMTTEAIYVIQRCESEYIDQIVREQRPIETD